MPNVKWKTKTNGRSQTPSSVKTTEALSTLKHDEPLIHKMHRMIGNQAVQRLFRQLSQPEIATPSVPPGTQSMMSGLDHNNLFPGQNPGYAIQCVDKKRKRPSKRLHANRDPVHGKIDLPSGVYVLRGQNLLGVPNRRGYAHIHKNRLKRGRLPDNIMFHFRYISKGGQQSVTTSMQNLLEKANPGSEIHYGHPPSYTWIRTTHAWERLGGKKQKIGNFSGYIKSGGPRAWKEFKRLRNKVSPPLTNEEIDVLSGIAATESNGFIGCVNTADDMYVSLGFKQVTLGWGTLQKIMLRAPKGFKKYGIKINPMEFYPKKGGIHKTNIHKISDTNTPDELRSPEWAAKFYAASMEDDVITELIKNARKNLRHVEKTVGSPEKGPRRADGMKYFDEPLTKSILTAVYNNRSSYMKKVVRQALRLGAKRSRNMKEFLRWKLLPAMLAVYPKTKLGRGLAWRIYTKITGDSKKWKARR